ncbi:hypothetical protein FOVSG1_015491 [Fusarium oxysporum f. sp. vasinfectum]
MDQGRLARPFIARFLTLVIVIAISWHLLNDATKSSEETALLPNITIIGTGGTIAGATNSPDKTTDYEAGIVQIENLTRGIDGAWRNNAVVHHEQFMSVDSININSSLAISLSQHITKLANNPYTQGIVLAHGTDLMSEMAMFLSLTVTSRIPIVMTGAMWPHTAFSADGRGNIIAAVKTAATVGWNSEGREVVIVIQGKIIAPWATKKDNNQFLPGPGSLLGDIKDFEPFFRWLPGPCTPIKFDISELSPEIPLPEVVIFQAHQDFPAYLIEVAISMGVKGIVLVGYGDGYWPAASAKEIRKLVHESRVVVVFAAEVDIFYLLEQLIAAPNRFSVEEKNRIRRNLEGFHPQTVSKAKPDSEEFFKIIMGFPNHKPRNIEKDIKVFPWKILESALKKNIGKYSVNPSTPAPPP